MKRNNLLITTVKKVKPIYNFYEFIINAFGPGKTPIEVPDFSIKRADILNISEKYKNATTFIETGTFMGDTIEFLKTKFLMIYSIELSEELATQAIKRFTPDKNIRIVQGNSAVQLDFILKEISTTCIFWLDGHYSSEFWVGNEFIKTAKGNKNTPILEELAQIINHPVNNHIILIDDARLFIGQNDYPTISRLKKFVSKRLPNHSFEVENDIIKILPKK